ncbi:MAG: enoyl-CoA hydratase/isomerase family protein [Thermoplasmata archaeon]
MAARPGTVRVERSGPRATIIWDRPPVHVFDIAMLDELARALRRDDVRSAHVVVLKGADHRWSAGFAVEDHLIERVPAMFAAFRSVVRALSEVPGPTLAQAEGPCLGGGLELLGLCDLAFGASTATFGQPEIELGVFPPLAAAWNVRALGPKPAAELLFLGESMGAERARDLGLLSRVVPAESIEGEVDAVALRLGRLRREALVFLKAAMHAGAPVAWAPFQDAERIYLDRLMALPRAEEGLRAFLEKRPPDWPANVPGGA